MHELFDLGVRAFLRIGTAMVMPPAALGDFVLADGAFRAEGTSVSYAPLGYPAVADFGLNALLRRRLAAAARPWHAGIFGTYDGFYTEMFALAGRRPRRSSQRLAAESPACACIAADMETAALLTAGRILGARTSSLCLGDGGRPTREKLAEAELARGERELFEMALDALAALLGGAPTQEEHA